MSEILSPEEKDALAEASRTARGPEKAARDKAPERPVRFYDFARPDKFSKEHMRILGSIHANYATGFSTTLGALLRLPVEAEPTGVGHFNYQDYLESIPENTPSFEVTLDGSLTTAVFGTTAIFGFDPSIISMCIDGLTGGAGGSGANVVDAAELTDLDRAIMLRILENLVDKYAKAWMPYLGLKAAVKDASLATPFNQVFLPAEPVLVCRYNVSLGEIKGVMSVCLRTSDVEGILPSLSASSTIGPTSTQTQAVKDALRKSVDDVLLPCRAILGRATLTTEEIINLQKGDVIKLDATPNSEVEFWIGNKKTYLGTPGLAGRNLGIQITRGSDDSQPSTKSS